MGPPIYGQFIGNKKCIATGKKQSMKYVCDKANHKYKALSYKSVDCSGGIKDTKEFDLPAQPMCVESDGTNRFSRIWCN
jgi:hypothetical protein